MVIKQLLYFTLFIVYVLIINVVSCPPGALIWKIKYLVSCIHIIFNLYQQYRHSMAAPSVTNAQGQVSVIQMQWSPEAGAKGTFDQADHSTDHSTH